MITRGCDEAIVFPTESCLARRTGRRGTRRRGGRVERGGRGPVLSGRGCRGRGGGGERRQYRGARRVPGAGGGGTERAPGRRGGAASRDGVRSSPRSA